MKVNQYPEFRQSWVDFHINVPSWLSHYTTADGLLGIVRDKSMFGTHYRFLNDSLEVVWGKELIEKHIEEYLHRAEEPVKAYLKVFQGLNIEDHYDVYIACFCANDNLLSQWRGYGKGGGYALAFRGHELAECQSTDRLLRRVIYDWAEQDRFVRLVLDWLVAEVSAGHQIEDRKEAGVAINEAFAWAWKTLCEMCVSFKLSVFEEEAEWRIVELVEKKEKLSEVEGLKFRSKAGCLIPYRSFPIERKAPKLIQPFDHVTCGPALSRDLTEQSLLMFLRAEGCASVWVRSSMIPLNAALG
jgi:hypothetical protein